MNMIVGKRQIILMALVPGLGIAVYLNWIYADGGNDFVLTGKMSETKNYGDAQYVESPLDIGDGEAYFAEAKITRTKSRDEAVETLKTMLSDSTLDADQKAELALQAAELAKSIETEGKIENLVKSKGFSECMVYYDTERVDVIVKTNGLLSNEAAQIKDIIVRETGVDDKNISIVEIN